jgi:hypothetical protein
MVNNMRWPKAMTKRFNELCAAEGYHWTYKRFCAVWPEQEFGHVMHGRWSGKNRIETDKRKKLAAQGSERANLRTNKRRLSAFQHGSNKRRLSMHAERLSVSAVHRLDTSSEEEEEEEKEEEEEGEEGEEVR